MLLGKVGAHHLQNLLPENIDTGPTLCQAQCRRQRVLKVVSDALAHLSQPVCTAVYTRSVYSVGQYIIEWVFGVEEAGSVGKLLDLIMYPCISSGIPFML